MHLHTRCDIDDLRVDHRLSYKYDGTYACTKCRHARDHVIVIVVKVKIDFFSVSKGLSGHEVFPPDLDSCSQLCLP